MIAYQARGGRLKYAWSLRANRAPNRPRSCNDFISTVLIAAGSLNRGDPVTPPRLRRQLLARAHRDNAFYPRGGVNGPANMSRRF